jgi:hypothetical protein
MKRIAYGFLFSLTLGFYACSNDIDLTADYKDYTVVYGLLDPKADTNWVRINKAFLGDGDALQFAQISDSLYYDSLYAYIQAYSAAGSKVGDSIVLRKMIDYFPKDSGIFAYDKNILYYTTEALNSNLRYLLTIIKPVQQDTTTASTILCKNFFMSYPPNSNTILSFEDQFGLNQNPKLTMKWGHDDNSYAYQLGIRFHYKEWVASDPGNKVDKVFEYYFPMFTIYGNGGGFNAEYYDIGTHIVKYEVFKTDFYGAVKSSIDADPAGTPSNDLHVRSFSSLDIIVLQASQELYKYITLNKPSLSFVQKLSDYTNISDGRGIFASRSNSGINGLNLNQQTRDSLSEGQFTKDLNFQ